MTVPSDDLSFASDAGPALATAARIGPYFAWQPYDGGPAWRPLAQWWDADVIAERVEARQVAVARGQGWSWQQIGDALGITRQSVHAKYGKWVS